MYRFPIVVGDRVALAPHLDLWMAGVRFGIVTSIQDGLVGGRFYFIDYGEGVRKRNVTVDESDLLGAVNAVPGQYAQKAGARSSTALSSPNPDSIGAGWPEEGL
jgi:hypothetical protein